MSLSITVKELISELKKLPEDAEVFTSIDEEGNGYCTLGEDSIEFGELDNAIILYPVRGHLDYDEIMPKEWERENDADERSVD